MLPVSQNMTHCIMKNMKVNVISKCQPSVTVDDTNFEALKLKPNKINNSNIQYNFNPLY